MRRGKFQGQSLLKPQGKSGFTLIELLVVVTIIALLIAILIPSLSRAKDRAKISACASNQKQDALAANMYASDWQTYLPPEYERGFYGYGFGTPASDQLSGTTGQEMFYMAGSSGALTLPAGVPNPYWGLAVLMNANLVTDGRVCFDPAVTDSSFSPKSPGPIGTVDDLGKKAFNNHLGYYYQEHSDWNWSNLQYSAGVAIPGKSAKGNPPSSPPNPLTLVLGTQPSYIGAGNALVGAAYPKTTNTPNNIFLMSCYIGFVAGTCPHGSGIGINGAFFDGHVEYIANNQIKGQTNATTTSAWSTQLSFFENQSAKNK